MAETGKVNVINTVDTQHADMIHDAQVNYYGRILATCSSDKTVKIFDVTDQSQSLQTTLVGHEGPVWQVDWAHPKFGCVLASCSYDRRVIVWKETNRKWEIFHEFREHKSSVNSVQWAPHEWGLVLACGSADESVSFLIYADGKWTPQYIKDAHSCGCNAVSWGPAINPGSLVDGSTQSPATSVKRIVTGGGDNLVKIWREDNDQWVLDAKLDGHTDWVRDVAWAPSIGLPVTRIASCSQDCKVIVWRRDEQESGQWTPQILNTFSDVVWHVSWSVTGDILAVSGGDNKVTLWKESPDGKWALVSDVNHAQQQQTQPTQ
jgi:protein transport protein SEC13